jgi:hypothetical protein
MNAPDYKMTCFNCILLLKYAMAGDMESVELLRQLEDRRRAIQWDDPAFLQLADDMRAPLPEFAAQGSSEHLLALLHAQTERLAEGDETANALIPRFKELIAEQKLQQAQQEKIFALMNKLAELHGQMRAKLQLLGADTTEYEIPRDLLS